MKGPGWKRWAAARAGAGPAAVLPEAAGAVAVLPGAGGVLLEALGACGEAVAPGLGPLVVAVARVAQGSCRVQALDELVTGVVEGMREVERKVAQLGLDWMAENEVQVEGVTGADGVRRPRVERGRQQEGGDAGGAAGGAADGVPGGGGGGSDAVPAGRGAELAGVVVFA